MMKIKDEAVEAAFQHWWKASKYCQVILPQPHIEQFARDGFRAAARTMTAALPHMGGVMDKRAIGAAIFDPGAYVGMKGDRTVTEWQVDAVMATLASHEPTSEPAKDGPEVVGHADPEALRTQHGWFDVSRSGNARYTVPLIRLSDYGALQAENERLRAKVEELTRERDEARSFQWYGTHAERLERRAEAAEARNAELMEALEPFANAKITYLDAPDGREAKAKHVHGLVYGDFRRARAALGG